MRQENQKFAKIYVLHDSLVLEPKLTSYLPSNI